MGLHSDEEIPALEHYQLESLLYRGKTSSIYKGVEYLTNHPVALKVLSSHYARTTIIRDHFIQAGNNAVRLNHIHIAGVYEVGTTDDQRPFIAMELVDGSSMADIINRREPLVFSKVADLLIQVCEGLRYAHEEGIIHRDIKPGNIMVTTEGTVKIVDFGLAKSFKGEEVSPENGPFLGTPRYMAPEQFNELGVDHRSDIYALGATFYHLLCGQPPFEAEAPDELQKEHFIGKVIPAYMINPAVSPALWEILEKMLEKEPSDRYQRYEEIIDELHAVKLALITSEKKTQEQHEIDQPEDAPSHEALAGPEPNYMRSPSMNHKDVVYKPKEKKKSPLKSLLPWGLFVLSIIALLTIGYNKITSPNRGVKDTQRGLRSIIRLIIPEKKKDFEVEPYQTTKSHMMTIYYAMMEYQRTEGLFPKTVSEIVEAGLISKDEAKDGWERHVYYLQDSGKICSFGKDGQENTKDDFVLDSHGNFVRQPSQAKEIEIGFTKDLYRR